MPMIVLNGLSHLESLSKILNEKGECCDLGCDEDRAEAIKDRLVTENTGKRVRLIRNWTVWDLKVSEGLTEELAAEGLKACVVYSTCIVWCGSSSGSLGKGVRSSLLVNLFDSCVFETRNSYYILVGHGSRKVVDPILAFSFFL